MMIIHFVFYFDGSTAVSNDTRLGYGKLAALHWEQLIVFPPLPSQKDLSGLVYCGEGRLQR